MVVDLGRAGQVISDEAIRSGVWVCEFCEAYKKRAPEDSPPECRGGGEKWEHEPRDMLAGIMTQRVTVHAQL